MMEGKAKIRELTNSVAIKIALKVLDSGGKRNFREGHDLEKLAQVI